MLNRLISRFINRQIEQGILKQEEREAYEYGYFLIALEIPNISVMAFIGILFRCFLPLLFFTVCLILLRKYAGGIHASSYVRCAAVSAVLELAVVSLLRTGLWQPLFLPAALAAICGCAVIWSFSPVAAAAKPLTGDETLRFRRTARRRLIAAAVLAVLLFALRLYLWAFIMMLDFIVIGGAMGVALFQTHRQRQDQGS